MKVLVLLQSSTIEKFNLSVYSKIIQKMQTWGKQILSGVKSNFFLSKLMHAFGVKMN